MKFEDYNPLDGKMFSILNAQGEVILPDELPLFSDKDLLYLYRTMLQSRILDERNLSYQRQGRMLTYCLLYTSRCV